MSDVIKVELWIKYAARNPADKYLSFKKFGNERKEKNKTIINRVRKRKDKTVYQDGRVSIYLRIEDKSQ